MTTGRFAPSPTGALHAGSMVAALASWLDARALGGRWLVRIEDLDVPRCVPGADRVILNQLARCGLVPDEPPLYQSQRQQAYRAALQRLAESGWTYPCACSRSAIDRALAAAGHRHRADEERIYPGTCRGASWSGAGEAPCATRIHTRHDGIEVTVRWQDRRLGWREQNLARAVGDFVLKRADGIVAYQLAVVVDDAEQAITDIVRGEDLADNTPRQIHLQQRLGLPRPRYLHVPLVLAADGHKLSKQNGAQPVDTAHPLAVLQAAGDALALPRIEAPTVGAWLNAATQAWHARWVA